VIFWAFMMLLGFAVELGGIAYRKDRIAWAGLVTVLVSCAGGVIHAFVRYT
jgi:hypothetical protein